MAWISVLLVSVVTAAGVPRAASDSSVAPSSVAPPPVTEPVPLPPTPAAWTFLGNRTAGVAGHGFVYDSRAGVFILFGGRNETAGFRDATWSYNATTDTWTNITPAVSPSPRAYFGMVYDSRADRVILFGGTSTGGRNNETWVFHLASGRWTQRSPKVSPPADSGMPMAYDAGSDRTILYGSAEWPNETWAYDYTSNTWTSMATSGSPGVFGGAMTYVPSAGRVILFGGYGLYSWYPPIYRDGTFAYDYANNTWTDRNPAAHPSGRDGSAMSLDSSAGRVLLFGGTTGHSGWCGLGVNETWAYDYERNNWTIVTPDAGPTARSRAAMAYDPTTGRTVLVGGQSDGCLGLPQNDTWAYRYGAAPPAPPRVLLAAPAADRITLSWQAPISDGGSAVTNYTLYRGETPGHESPLVTVGPVLSYVDDAVTLGTTECYRVAAANALGSGQASNEVCATPAEVPSAPRNLAATPGLARVTLTWQAPLSTGGLAVAYYVVYRGSQGEESFFAWAGSSLTFEDREVTNGSAYYYRVAAVNAVGQGPMSNEAAAALPTTPSAPRNLAGKGEDGLVRLTWSAPSSTGGTDVTGYKVYRGEAAGPETLFATLGVVYSFADSTVTNGRTYYYWVSAVNAVGEGSRSNAASVAPDASADATPPTVAIVSPSDSDVLASAAVTVTGIASDNVAVDKIELSTDGTTWVAATGTTSWSGHVTLHEGSNTIYARATDTSGNAHQTNVTVRVVLAGTPSPASQEPQGLDPSLLAGVAVMVVAVSAAAAFVIWRRRANGRRPVP